ncbi:MAG: hypothetical protein F6K53_40745 [Moorea sp. SIO4A1]|uniref:hypothetical protein n=1 Tax=Moorena sp. SIO4A1 TaxID=2607835 RepID=UPI00144E54B9|nr:hypothetical protein [Moorena sp. SIO4A1]NEQ63323.1 hypothetical protein [Moorena sp. SIO4A1]
MANLILNAEKAPLRSWGASAVLGVPPTRGLAWFPPLALCIKKRGKLWPLTTLLKVRTAFE